jgi:AbrB family looped-hinge helix DNA binding protein
MKIIKKMDDLGRICVPKEIRRSLRWMGGDEIEIVLQEDGSVNLRKHEDNTIAILQDLRKRFDWREDSDIDNYFIDLIEAIKEKTE